MLTRAGVRGTCAVFAGLAFLFLASGAQAQPRASSDLLLPYFEVGVSQGDATTILVVSNTLDKPVDLLATVQTSWGIAVLPVTLKLKARELLTIDLRDWLVVGNLPDRRLSAADLLHLQAALTGKSSPRNGLYYSAETASGRAVGSLVLRTLGDRPDALRGQYFQVEPGQGTSRTLDLADIDGPSVLCNRHTVRHLVGRPLAGTQVVVWTQPAGEALPAPTVQDRRLSVAVSVFSPAGALVKQHTLRLLPVARVSLADLGLTQLLGRVELATAGSSAVAVYPAGSATFERSCVQAPANQPKVQITTLVNGQDANTQPGPSIPVGNAVTWTYQVRNAGVGTLSKIVVTDDAAGAIKCPQKTLKPGQSMSCTRKGLAEACLHRNVGQVRAATEKRGTVTAQDPAFYMGDDGSAIEIEAATNGLDADDPVGPRVPAGSRVDWTYRVQNTGSVRLFQISVKDDHGVAVDCPRVSLGPGEPMICVASGTAVPGQYRNVATATATAACGKITASDVSHYFGESDAGLQLRALTNGYDADFPPGPSIPVGRPVTWEYVVTNSGRLEATGVGVADDRGVAVSCPDTVLQPGASMTCLARGVASPCQYASFATASGRTSQGLVSASNASHYFGQSQAAVQVESLVNGDDADLPPGPSVAIGNSVQWSYVVTNLGTVTLSGLSVKDDRGGTVTCPKTVLQPGEAMTCSGSGAAVAGDYRSLATVTAQPPCGSAVSDDDAGHYRGTGDPGIRIQKLTNGQDVSAPPGPSVAVGSVVSWTYIVTNTGRFPLSGVTVTDSRGVAVTCPRSDLPLGESMTCTGRGTAQACQYDNLAAVTARTSGGQQVMAVDASYYFGNVNPGLQIKTTANGDESDSPPGPTVAVGSPVTWIYRITNSGDAPLTNVLVTDDRGALVVCPRTILQARETMSCTASGTAVEGQFKTIGTVTATPPCGAQLSAEDASHYFGGGSAGIGLRKLTNGVDVNDPPGPAIPLGNPVTWSYVVTNTGQVALSGVGVTDSRGVSVICPQTTLNPGQSMTCTGTGTAQACQYDNLGIATGQTATGQKVNAVDPSYYFGSIQPGVAIETRVNGQDADAPPGPTVPAGSSVAWTYIVTNTGNVSLANVRVSDSPGALVTCPKTSLDPGEQMTCSASGTAVEGLFSNAGSVTAAPPCGAAVSAQDPSHYTGSGSSGLQLRKLVNGQDAVQPPGPTISVGTPVLWSYEVTNTGQVTLSGISVVDDQGVLVSCPQTALQPGQSMTCTGRGIARACQYANLGRATGFTSTSQLATAVDSSWYFGEAHASVGIETAVNGFSADSAPGPTIIPGSPVTWTYTVVNTGDVRLSNLVVGDNQGPQVSCPRTGLDPGESMACFAIASAVEGPYSNVGTVTGTPPCGAPVSAQDPSHYTGGGNAGLSLQKLLNGQNVPAPPGPTIPLNQPITWTYRVANTGQVALSGVGVTDSRGVTVSCPRTTLQPGATMDCTGTGTVQACAYENVGLATGRSAAGQQVNAVDLSYYTGQIAPRIEIQTAVNGQDADTSPGPSTPVGSTATLSYLVTNTGNVPLANVRVVEESGALPSCPKTTLQPGEVMTCFATRAVTEGPSANRGLATADPPCGAAVSASDPTFYTGGGSTVLQLQKLINGQDAPWPGPSLPIGQQIVWSYVVTNNGQVSVNALQVRDDDLSLVVDCSGRTTLQPGESVTCTARGTARACPYVNVARATVQSASGPVSVADSSFYNGTFTASVQFETSVNGNDADTAPGVAFAAGSTARWTYRVTNTGQVELRNVRLSDDQGLVSCTQPALAAGASMTCSVDSLVQTGSVRVLGLVTADPPCGSTLSAQDPTYYFSETPGLQLQKLTNSQDVAQPPGPTIAVGSPVIWSYVVTNTGLGTLSGISVFDDQGVLVSCPQPGLQPGQSMTCTGRGVARACQYANLGRATGLTATGQQVTAVDSSWYFGEPRSSVGIETAVNGFAADLAPGPTILPGSPVTWTYTVVNTGDVRLSNILVSDNQGPQVTCPRTVLDPGESMACSATATAIEGPYSNVGTVTGTPPCGQPVSAQDSSHYTGGGNAGLSLQKLLNGQDVPAPPGPTIPLGQALTWTYRVTNTGQVALSGVGVTDSRGVTVSCPRSTLQPGETMDCTGAGTAQACAYENVGLATGQSAAGQQVNAVDLSYYTGQTAPRIEIQTAVNGQDADTAPGPSVTVGSMATLSYLVTNMGNVSLTGVRVSEESGAIVTCPKTSLQPGEVMACYAMRAVTEGPSANRGLVTAEPPCGPSVTASDPTHYTGGGNTGLQLQKLINGQDAAWPGPSVPAGQPVVWSYIVTNTGQVSVNALRVTDDDPSLVPDCAGRTTLQPGESVTCTARGTTRACQYVNLAKATAQNASGPVTAADSSFYNGTFEARVLLETSVNGNDADTAPGVTLAAGTTARWIYRVTNPGQVDLRNVRVSDDQGIVNCAQPVLAAGASMTCIVDSLVQTGSVRVIGMVTADPPCGSVLSAQDPTYYVGERHSIAIQTLTNGQNDATIVPGTPVNWTYRVTNTGTAVLTNVVVTDSRNITVSCPKTTLQPGETMTCTTSSTLALCGGPYVSTGSVTATTPTGSSVNASDSSSYRGVEDARLQLETYVRDPATGSYVDADLPLFPQGPVYDIPPFSATVDVQFMFVVTNTGNVPVSGITISDEYKARCAPSAALSPGQSSQCNFFEPFFFTGQRQNHGTSTGRSYCGALVVDDDPTYFGVVP